MGLETIFGKGEKERNVKKKKNRKRESCPLKSSPVFPSFSSPFTISPANATVREDATEGLGWDLGACF